MKTIYLARHAKSSWSTNAISDFDRPLNKRGEGDAVKIANELLALDWIPEKIISSPAMRAKQTCNAYVEILDYPTNSLEWDEGIYEAPTSKLLNVLTSLDEKIDSVMLIGHNPSMEGALEFLCGYSEMITHQQDDGKIFTTGNVVRLTTDSPWKDLKMEQATLERILRPKEI